jgi:hypothetical protein
MLFMIIILLFILFFLLISIATIINPYYIWRITESWKANREPSKEYFIFCRIGGIIGTIFGLYFLIALFSSFS